MNRAQIFFVLLLFALLALIASNAPPARGIEEMSTREVHPAQALNPPHTAAPPAQTSSPTQAGDSATPEPVTSPVNVPTLPPRSSSAPEQVPAPQLSAEQWRDWPVIPTIPNSVHAIYLRGLELGNDPTNFSTIGDCQSVPLVFMGDYDLRPEFWPPYDYTNLMPTLLQFQGSFGHRSGAIANGMSAASVFSPLWVDLNICEAGETPLECEFRLQKPGIVFINLGTNYGKPEKHEEYLRDILDFVIERGAVPILSTKGDNAEGDWSINQVIVQVALEYDVPLWNFWAAIQDLPNLGLDEARPEGNYLTREAWDVRSITGLQVLDVLRNDLQLESPIPDLQLPTALFSPSPSPLSTPSPTPDTRPLPNAWRTWPIVPTLSANLIPVFLDGQSKGKNPYAFTTLGDCQSEPPVFMGIYSTDRYFLGTGYEYLQETIDFFAQSHSFERQSYCTQNGLSVASALSPAWADPDDCETGETPLACEIRIHQPSLMFINLGTNWSVNATPSHEAYLRQIVDLLLAEGVIPILSTKGDNVEGDWSINQSIAQVAYDTDLPLWNFWAAIQHLPKDGLDPDRPGGNYLIIEAWDRRSFTGLQVLDAIRRTLEPYYP